MKQDVEYNTLLHGAQTNDEVSSKESVSNTRLGTFILGIFFGMVFTIFVQKSDPARTKSSAESDFVLKSEPAHAKSLAESNGWFDVPDEKWNKIKELHFKTRNNQIQVADTWTSKGKYINWNWFESISCPLNQFRLGVNDGGKVICDPYRLEADDCLVYSIGSNGDFQFEESIKKLNPNCEIHTFDHTWTPNGSEKGKTIYHKIGLGSKKHGEIDTLENIVKDLGHVNRRIEVLKIDCEGCETEVYPNFYMQGVNIGQLMMETHFQGSRGPHEEMMENLQKNGFAIFSKEPNTGYSDGRATEWTFLRLNAEIFNR